MLEDFVLVCEELQTIQPNLASFSKSLTVSFGRQIELVDCSTLNKTRRGTSLLVTLFGARIATRFVLELVALRKILQFSMYRPFIL